MEAAERFAEGSIGAEQMRAVFGNEADTYNRLGASKTSPTTQPAPATFGAEDAARISRLVVHALAAASFPDADYDHEAYLCASSARDLERETHAAELRCVIGNPFRPATIAPSNRTPDVLAIARDAYVERALPEGDLDPARLAVLSDALEDAGCETALLDHLRAPGPHVRGCWVLDLILGKS